MIEFHIHKYSRTGSSVLANRKIDQNARYPSLTLLNNGDIISAFENFDNIGENVDYVFGMKIDTDGNSLLASNV